MELKFCINYMLTVTQHAVSRLFTERLSAFGITPGQYGVLQCLWRKGSCTPKEITQTLRLESSTISGVLDRMQKQGLIDRFTDQDDRRSVHVIATGEGKALEDDVLRVIAELNQEIMGGFTEEERETVFRCLWKIADMDQDDA